MLLVRQSRISLISSKYGLKKTELSCAVFQIIVLLHCFALVQLVTTISLHFENSIKLSQLIVQIYKLPRAASRTARRCDILVLFVARCTLVISGAVQSG